MPGQVSEYECIPTQAQMYRNSCFFVLLCARPFIGGEYFSRSRITAWGTAGHEVSFCIIIYSFWDCPGNFGKYAITLTRSTNYGIIFSPVYDAYLAMLQPLQVPRARTSGVMHSGALNLEHNPPGLYSLPPLQKRGGLSCRQRGGPTSRRHGQHVVSTQLNC